MQKSKNFSLDLTCLVVVPVGSGVVDPVAGFVVVPVKCVVVPKLLFY
jgi:hypothetical protein